MIDRHNHLTSFQVHMQIQNKNHCRDISREQFDILSDHTYRNIDVVQNLSIVSHLTALGHGARGIDADLGDIALTAQSFTDRARSELPCEGLVDDDGDPDHAPSTPQEVVKHVTNMELVKSFFITGLPLTLASLTQFSINFVTIAIIGKLLGVDELGGATLALSLMNATGFAFGTGLCGALETVLSHTYGEWEKTKQLLAEQRVSASNLRPRERNPSPTDLAQPELTETESSPTAVEQKRLDRIIGMYGIYTQRMVFILLAVAVPLGAVLCFADSFLGFMGESPVSIYYMGRWCRIAIFGLPVTLAIPLVQRYYSCQRITKPLLVATFSAAVVNPALQFGFIKAMGYEGSSLAWILLMVGLLIGIILYLRCSGLHRLTWKGWSKKSIENLGPLSKLAFPSMGIMLSEWVAIEIVAILAAFAPPVELGAFSISLQIFSLLWGVCSGVIVISSVFVGNAIGGRKPLFARRIALISIVLVFLISCVDVGIMLILDPYIPYAFTNDRDVAKEYQKLMYILLPYHIVDTLQSTMMAI